MNTLLLFAQQAPDNAGDGGAALLGGVLGVMVIFWVLAIAATVFWVWMLIDVLTSRRETNDKILWFLVVFFLHFIGALIYFFVARQRRGSAAVGPAT